MRKIEIAQYTYLKAQRTSEKKELNWTKICSKSYRSTTENEGLTELWKLELACKKLPLILSHDANRGLVLVSRASGKGKTRAMWRLLRRLWNEGRSIQAFTSASFQRAAQDAAGNYESTAWFRELATCNVFFLDDLGKGQWTANTHGTWFDLVESRTNEGLPIFITTNHTSTELAERSPSGPYTMRRIKESCSVLSLD